MDKSHERERFRDAAGALGIELSGDGIQPFFLLRDELLRWNQKVNLTAITDPVEVLEKHFLDSLAPLPWVKGPRVLDVGSGGGFPGLPWALVRPELDVTLVDAVAKKVGFIKHAVARLGLTARARAQHLRLEGNPEKEGLGLFDTVVSRALMDLEPWLKLGRSYLMPGGELLSMVARVPAREELEAHARASGMELLESREYRLPWSGDPRGVVRFRLPSS